MYVYSKPHQLRGGATATRINASRAGSLLCYAGAVLAALGLAVGAYFERISLIPFVGLAVLGCLISLIILRTWPTGSSNLALLPAYGAAWVYSFPFIYNTGGLVSPFITDILILLLFAGALVRWLERPFWLISFIVLNYLFWIGTHAIGFHVEAPHLEEWFIIAQKALFLTASICCAVFFLKTKAADQQSQLERAHQLAEMREKLIHSARLSETGTMVASTTHELAQPLQIITTCSTVLEKLVTADSISTERITKIIKQMCGAATQMLQLHQRLHDFVRNEPVRRESLDFCHAVCELQAMVKPQLDSKNIVLTTLLPDCPAIINGDSTQIRQVILNLINNARDAVQSVSQPEITLAVEVNEARARLCVWDNGTGIPQEIQGKLFDRFFTTKPRGQGTGLGLSICADIINEHGGRILFSSQPNRTVFIVDFPLLDITPVTSCDRPLAGLNSTA